VRVGVGRVGVDEELERERERERYCACLYVRELYRRALNNVHKDVLKVNIPHHEIVHQQLINLRGDRLLRVASCVETSRVAGGLRIINIGIHERLLREAKRKTRRSESSTQTRVCMYVYARVRRIQRSARFTFRAKTHAKQGERKQKEIPYLNIPVEANQEGAHVCQTQLMVN
jgi:hypothetical protein